MSEPAANAELGYGGTVYCVQAAFARCTAHGIETVVHHINRHFAGDSLAVVPPDEGMPSVAQSI